MTNKKLKNLEEKLSNIQRKIDPDCIDSLQGHDLENFKNYTPKEQPSFLKSEPPIKTPSFLSI